MYELGIEHHRIDGADMKIEVLSAHLQERVGRGYSVRNLRYFRSFYQAYADREPLIRDARGEFGTGLVPNLGEVGARVAAAGRQAPATENARIRHVLRAESEGGADGLSPAG